MYPLPISQMPVANRVPLGMLFIALFPIPDSARQVWNMGADTDDDEEYVCTKCGHVRQRKDYYIKSNGARFKHCKQCHLAMKKKPQRDETRAKHEQEIREAMEAGCTTARDIATHLDICRELAYERLVRLECSGLVRRNVARKNITWSLTK